MTASSKQSNHRDGFQMGRREALLAGLGVGVGAGMSIAGAATAFALDGARRRGLVPSGGPVSQTVTLQQALNQAAASGKPLFLPAGIYKTGKLTLESGTHVHGVSGRTILRSDGTPILAASEVDNVRLSGLVLDGSARPLGEDGALMTIAGATKLDISTCRFLNSGGGGLSLREASGRIASCSFGNVSREAIFSEDARGIEISNNNIRDCGDNGIVVWRSRRGEDGTRIANNRIERIAARSGGREQHGNGINVFRADSVLVNQNRISDCAFSAVRSNASSNCQMVGNTCSRLGDVALCAEVVREGALIANNIVDTAASGISVTGCRDGGGLAVVQGNIVRNLFFRKTGEVSGSGIAVEADTSVTHNVVEGAPAYGILVGRGKHLRNVSVTRNVVRKSHIGIGVAAGSDSDTEVIADNLIDGAQIGAIRPMKGETSIGRDLAGAGAEPYRKIAVRANVVR
jgi:uncharacterized secreted repeat protein (TIGR03808 family)